jgi:hypothetical protein
MVGKNWIFVIWCGFQYWLPRQKFFVQGSEILYTTSTGTQLAVERKYRAVVQTGEIQFTFNDCSAS